jgi:hypothetical protein
MIFNILCNKTSISLINFARGNLCYFFLLRTISVILISDVCSSDERKCLSNFAASRQCDSAKNLVCSTPSLWKEIRKGCNYIWWPKHFFKKSTFQLLISTSKKGKVCGRLLRDRVVALCPRASDRGRIGVFYAFKTHWRWCRRLQIRFYKKNNLNNFLFVKMTPLPPDMFYPPYYARIWLQMP